MKYPKLKHSYTKGSASHFLHEAHYAKECDICGRSFTATTRYQRVRFGTYYHPKQEMGVETEYVCKTCYDCSYGFIYEMHCLDCGSVQSHNRKCDGPYSCYLFCDTCKLKPNHERNGYTRHTRGDHAADVSKEAR